MTTPIVRSPLALDPPPNPATACVRWTGRIGRDGYGRIGRRGLAHRVAWERERGPIPAGMTIDHLCRVRNCVNVEHMEAVTQLVNTMRGYSPNARNARKAQCSHGHPFDPANTYIYTKRTGRVTRICRTCNRAAVARRKARRSSER